MMESEWTEAGSRIIGEATPSGVIILTCQSQAVMREGEKVGRGIWWVSQLAIPLATARGYADRLVRHWLAFFEDEALARNGLKLFRDLFESLPQHASGGGQAPRGGMN